MKIISLLCLLLLIGSCGPKDTAHDYFSKGKTLYDDERDSLAIISLTKAIELDSNYKDAYYLRAYSNHRYGKFEAAIDDYSKTIEFDPNHDEAYYFRGVVKGTINDFSGAISDYSKAIEINPKNGEAFHNRGMMRFNLGMKDSACADFQMAKNLQIPIADSAMLRYCKID
jgi:tetratricopeptide (TPR) repeat protein